MHRIDARTRAAVVLAALVLAPAASGLTVLRMGLGELCKNGHRIVRGTVLSSVEGTVQLGGARIPVTTYRMRVDETFKGTIHSTKGDPVLELRTLGKAAPVEVGGLVRAPLLTELPQLEIGATYLLFTTRPARVGLATTVGLGQGCFRIQGQAEKETAANELDNAGLFAGTRLEGVVAPGPVPYGVLAQAIRDTLADQGASP